MICVIICNENEKTNLLKKDSSDHIRQFAKEILPQLNWDLVPFNFLYDLFRSWYKKKYSDESCIYNSTAFRKKFLAVLPEFPDWECKNPSSVYQAMGRMEKPEPLIARYNLKEWMNPMYSYDLRTDVTKLCHPVLKSGYKGILRVNPTSKKGA